MGVFSSILKVLGIGKEEKAAEESKLASSAPGKPATSAKPASSAATASPADRNLYTRSKGSSLGTSDDMPMVDVVSKLEGMAAKSAEKLDWKVSIVDLLKLLGIDSSREARNELATELNIPAELMEDSAKMNVWLHKEVLKGIAKNGGNIPKELLD